MAQRFLILASRFNETITKALLSGAQDAFADAGIQAVDTLWVPGCFELPTTAMKAATSRHYAAIVCLGAVIRGETPHFDIVAKESARGLMRAGVATGVPVINGILTTDTVEQALNRAGIKGGNKGADAARGALAMVKTMSRLEELTRK